ncbi:MAG: MBL fold metallo-hydrolase [Gammaproteobacteria bacterium]
MTFRFLLSATLSLLTVSATAQQAPDLTEILDPSGNVERLDELSWSANGEMFDPAQTIVSGARSRHITSYNVDGNWQPGDQTDYAWSLNIHYPFPSLYTYNESMDGSGGGEIDGSDGFRPSAQGALPGARVGARAKFLVMTMPALLLASATDVSPIPGQPGSYHFDALDSEWRVHVSDGRLTRLSTTENDPLFGTVDSAIHYSDWRDVEGIAVPAKVEYRVDGQLIQQEEREAIEVTLAARDRRYDLSPNLDDGDFARGWNMANFFLRRIALGGPADTDQSYPVELLEVGDGVYQAMGSSHHSLVIETDNGLIIIDAPLYPSRSVAILEALEERWPDRPVHYVILTHHHYDHSGGATAYAAEGIPLIVHSTNADFFGSLLASQGLDAAPITGVGDRLALSVDGVNLELYDIPTSHVAGMLMVYLSDQRLVFNSDLYSPGRETQHQLWASELQQAVRFLDLEIDAHVGAHGRGTGSAGELAQVVAGN